MKRGQNLLKNFLISGTIFLSIGCHSLPPKVELCIIGNAGCICHDDRLPVGEQDYVRTFEQCVNYIATNPVDYQTMQEYFVRKCSK